MPTPAPSPDWNRLDRAAVAFWKLAPWSVMSESEPLAIDHPEHGVLFLSCGDEGGEAEPVVTLFMSAVGLDAFDRMKILDGRKVFSDALYRLDMITLARVSPEEIDDDETPLPLPQFAKLARGTVPVIERRVPAELPLRATGEEAALLAEILEIVAGFIERTRPAAPEWRRGIDDWLTLVHRDGAWTGEWRTGEELMKVTIDPPVAIKPSWNAVRVLPQTDEVWEFAVHYLPTIERPARMLAVHMIIDGGESVLVQALEPRRDNGALAETLIHAMIIARRRPHEVLVDDPELYEVLDPIAREFGVLVGLETWLPVLGEEYDRMVRKLLELDGDDDGPDSDELDAAFVIPRTEISVTLVMPEGFRHGRLTVRYAPFDPEYAASMPAKEVERIERVQVTALEDPKRGLKDLRALAAKYPNIPSIHANLAATLIGLEKFVEAGKVMVRNFKRFPRHINILTGYCDLMLVNGEVEAALAAYDGCTELPDFRPDRTEFHYSEVVSFHAMLAKLCRILGRADEAKRHVEVVSRVAPGHPLLREI